MTVPTVVMVPLLVFHHSGWKFSRISTVVPGDVRVVHTLNRQNNVSCNKKKKHHTKQVCDLFNVEACEAVACPPPKVSQFHGIFVNL